jgi:hypothetical protein
MTKGKLLMEVSMQHSKKSQPPNWEAGEIMVFIKSNRYKNLSQSWQVKLISNYCCQLEKKSYCCDVYRLFSTFEKWICMQKWEEFPRRKEMHEGNE